MAALHANVDENSMYLLDEFVTTQPGEPYRLFKFGRVIKGGIPRDITPELARQFRLPHFKPPIKLGSHADTTPAGGHIVGLEVREDGLYAVPEYVEKGLQTLADGAYRYQSPEVIWPGGGLEDPVTGDFIEGPLIVGDALLHTPHLGEAAALYSVEPVEIGGNMAEETVQVPKGIFDTFVSWFKRTAEPQPEPEAPAPAEPVIPDEYKAAVVERDELKARLVALEAQQAQNARVEGYAAQLKETKIAEGAEMLASMTDEQAGWVVTQFKALSAQVNESALTGEVGSTGDGPTEPKDVIEGAVKAHMEEHKEATWLEAFDAVRHAQPDLFAAYGKKA